MTKRSELLVSLCDLIKDHDYSVDPNDKKSAKPLIKSMYAFVNIITGNLADFRVAYLTKYSLQEIILAAFFAMIQNCDTFNEIEWYTRDHIVFLRRFLPFKHGAPSHDTFRRVFCNIQNTALEAVLGDFILGAMRKARRYYAKNGYFDHLAIDGKGLRGSGRLLGTNQALKNIHALNVYDSSTNITLLSKKIPAKTSEITAVQSIIPTFTTKNTIFSLDALHAQKKTVTLITKGNAHFLIALKPNHAEFYREIETAFQQQHHLLKLNPQNYFKFELEKHRSTLERREYFMLNANQYYRLAEWPGLRRLVMMKKTISTMPNMSPAISYHYYLTSLKNLPLIADVARAHWQIENNLHWHLDRSMREDDSLIANPTAAMNMSSMRKLCLTFLKILRDALNDKTSIKGARKRVGWAPDKMMITLFAALDDTQLLKKLHHKTQI